MSDHSSDSEVEEIDCELYNLEDELASAQYCLKKLQSEKRKLEESKLQIKRRKKEERMAKLRELHMKQGRLIHYYPETPFSDTGDVTLPNLEPFHSHPKDKNPALSEILASRFLSLLQRLQEKAFCVPGFLCKADNKVVKEIQVGINSLEPVWETWKSKSENKNQLKDIKWQSGASLRVTSLWSLTLEIGDCKLERYRDKSGSLRIGKKQYDRYGSVRNGDIWNEPEGFKLNNQVISSHYVHEWIHVVFDIANSKI